MKRCAACNRRPVPRGVDTCSDCNALVGAIVAVLMLLIGVVGGLWLLMPGGVPQ